MYDNVLAQTVKERLLIIAYKTAVIDKNELILNLIRRNEIKITKEALYIHFTRINLASFMLQTDSKCSQIIFAAYYKSAYPKGHNQL